jgi:hypothetical protein
LLKKFQRAKKGLTETKPAYEGLADTLDAVLVSEWKQEERQALEKRGDLLRIYDVKFEKGNYILFTLNCVAWLKGQKRHPKQKFVFV